MSDGRRSVAIADTDYTSTVGRSVLAIADNDKHSKLRSLILQMYDQIKGRVQTCTFLTQKTWTEDVFDFGEISDETDGKWEEEEGSGMFFGQVMIYPGNQIMPWTGYGVWKFTDGMIYCGEWKKGRPWNGTGGWSYGPVWDLRPPWDPKSANINSFEGRFREGEPCDGTCTGVFDGTLENGMPLAGRGVWLYANGYEHAGEFRRGRPVLRSMIVEMDDHVPTNSGTSKLTILPRKGRGRVVCTSGDIFEGSWTDGHASQDTKCIFLDGSVLESVETDEEYTESVPIFQTEAMDIFYSAMTANDDCERMIVGKLSVPNGDCFVGAFFFALDQSKSSIKVKIDKGSGKWTFENGDVCQGVFHDGRLVDGERHCADGDVEKGHFVDGALKEGTRSRANGDVEKGTFCDGLLHGKGSCTYGDDGSTYVGGFKRGKKHGNGTMAYAEGDTYNGGFVDDRQNGEGRLQQSNGDWYEGTFKDHLMNGPGEAYLQNQRYVGEFKHHKFNGKGTLEDSLGTYEGEMRNDLRHGEGTQVDPDGGIQTGTWVHGRLHGEVLYTEPGGRQIQRYVLEDRTFCLVRLQDAARTIQAHARARRARARVRSLRRDLGDRITAEQALKMHREYLEQRDKKLGMRVRNKKPTMEPKAVAPRAGRSRAGGSKKGRKAKSPKQVVADDTEGVAWCEEVLRGPLRKQADCERYRRSLAANTATAPDPPACIGSVNLHGYSVATAIEVLRSQIIGAKPRKKCNHLMVITGKGEHAVQTMDGEEYGSIKGEVRKNLDGAWNATYSTKRASDGAGTDGFYVKITKKLQRDVKQARQSQISPTRPGVTVKPRTER